MADPCERREEIIETAGRLFMQNGFEKTTLLQVAEQLNVTKATIYRHFSSKDALLAEVVDYLTEHSARHLQAILVRTRGTGLDRLRQLVEGIVVNNTMHHRQTLEQMHLPANIGVHIHLNARVLTAHAPYFAELIRQGCAEGLFHTEHPLESAEFILASIQFLTDIAFFPWTKEQLQRRIVSLPGMIESLLHAPPGSFRFMLDLVPAGSPGIFMPMPEGV